MDFYISIHTLNKLDNILNSYKKTILKDFHSINNLSIDYETFEKNILERKINKPIIYSSGIGRYEDITLLNKIFKNQAISISSALHYKKMELKKIYKLIN